MVLCGISSRFQLLFPWYGQIAHALLTRPPLTYQPKSISSFDLHVLSMPPAFILSQNQTLKFNCLKSLHLCSNGSNYLLSLCWLAFKVTLFKYFEKINGNYLSFACLSNKISFLSYSIFNLLLTKLSSSVLPLAATACISYHIAFSFVKHFFAFF